MNMDRLHGGLIGGSPSTGSSLLVQILNRHSIMSAGPETFLFMHLDLWSQWEDKKNYLIEHSRITGLKSSGWFMLNGAHLNHAFFGWSKEDLAKAIEAAEDFPQFYEAFFQKSLQIHGKKIWWEKTPSSALSFAPFLEHSPTGAVIHCLRDPYDTMASLVARGHSPSYATAAYLINNAFAAKAKNHPNYQLIRYEALVTTPEDTIRKLMASWSLEFEPKMLEHSKKKVKITSWENSETEAISSKSIGRFQNTEEGTQTDILQAFANIEITPQFVAKHQLPFKDAEGFFEMFDYPTIEAPELGYFQSLVIRKDLQKEMWARTFKMYPTGGWNFPVRLK